MREIIYVERSAVTKDGKTIFSERKYHGCVEADGSIRLLACCGKQFSLKGEFSAEMKPMTKMSKRAA